MDIKRRINENTAIVQEQIKKFDSKANILIAIVGIVFAISLGIMETLPQLISKGGYNDFKSVLLLIFIILYFCAFTIEMIFLISVIYPRGKRGETDKSVSYYLDVSQMKPQEINKALEAEDHNAETNQLIINAKICSRKHFFLVRAIWTLIPLFAFVMAMFFLILI